MSKNVAQRMNDLYLQFAAGALSRRQLMQGVSALGVSAAAVSVFMRGVPANAQEASPVATPVATPGASPVASPVGSPVASPVASYEPFTSINREQYQALLKEWWASQERPYEEPQNQGGQVVMGESATSFLSTTNAMMAAEHPTLTVMTTLVNETLQGSSPIDGQYVPALADYWTIAEDGKTYTYYLNQNARWHDGTPLTAADVAFSYDIQANPDTSTSYQATLVATAASWTAIDDHTFQVIATDVFAPVVFYGNTYAPIMAKHVWESVAPTDWASHPGSTGEDLSKVVGTGPFKLTEFDPSQGRAVFVKNTDYYDVQPNIEEFIFITSGDDAAAIENLRTGGSDFFENVPPPDVESLDAEETISVAIYPTLSFSWYGFNLDPAKTTLFQDVLVRRALFHAIDRPTIIENINLGYSVYAKGSQPTVSVAYAPDRITTDYVYDPERAKALLAEAGWVDSDGDGIVEKDGQLLSFEVMYGSGSATTDATVAAMQEMWLAVGAQATPNPVDFNQVLVPALTDTFDYQMCLLAFNWDPTADQSAMFATSSYRNGFNAMKYSNPRVDELFVAASKELDQAKRIDLLVEAQNVINEDLPVAILWFRQDRTAYSTRLHNFFPNAYGLLWSVPYMWVDPS